MTAVDSKYTGNSFYIWRFLVPVLAGAVLFLLVMILIILPAIEQFLLQSKRTILYELTAAAQNLIDGYNEQVIAGEIQLPEAQERALYRLQHLRYGPDNKDYFWVHDTNHVMLMHPYQPELVNQNLKEFTDPNNKRIIFDMVNMVSTTDQGYINYLWPWKDSNGPPVPKISHIRLYAPWGWIIGTGMYTKDVEETIAAITLKLTLATTAILAILLLLASYFAWKTLRIERKRQDEFQAKQMLNTIIESTTDLVVVSSLNGRITYMNLAASNRLLITPFSPQSQHFLTDLFPPDVFAQLSTTGFPAAIEYGIWTDDCTMKPPGSEPFPVSLMIMTHYNAERKPAFQSLIMRDISNTRAMESRLLQSQADLEKRVAERTRAIEQTNRQLKIEVAERKVAEYSLRFRADFEKLINTVSADFINCPADQTEERMIRALAEIGWFLQVDNCFVALYSINAPTLQQLYTGSGDDATIRDYLNKLHIPTWDWFNQRLIDDGIVRYTAPDSLPSQEKDARALFTQAHIGSMICIPLRNANSITGFWCVQTIKKQILWPEDLIMLFKVLGEVMAHAMQRKINEEEKLRLEAQLRQAQKMESIGQLAAGIAHEINTPVQFVGDNIRFLADAFTDIEALMKTLLTCIHHANGGDLSAQAIHEFQQAVAEADWDYVKNEAPKAFEQALDGVQRISKIVKAMKEFSHPGSEGKQNADINKIIENTIIVAHSEWKYIAQLDTAYDENIPLVYCQRDELSQVILNILINACHAIEANHTEGDSETGHILISTHLKDDQVLLAIADNGPGIPSEIGARIFDPFFTTKNVGKGTGQGLYIAYDIIVNKHQGELSYTCP